MQDPVPQSSIEKGIQYGILCTCKCISVRHVVLLNNKLHNVKLHCSQCVGATKELPGRQVSY